MMEIKLIVNQECHGLELYFAAKPEESILTQLKDAGWRYHRVKKCWYAKQTDENQQLAEVVSGIAVPDTSQAEEEKPYFPPYASAGGTPIWPTADMSCWDHNDGYFQDINAYIHVRPQRITIVDLTNALIPGKECESITFEKKDEYSSLCLYSGCKTMRDLYERFYVKRELPETCRVYTRQRRSMETFTPFKQIKPIRIPKKWTLPHVWKAILAGQVYQGKVDGKYSDDYAYDAAMGYHEGRQLDLPSFAKELIESSSGWRVTATNTDGDKVTLSVDCYSFDMNTLLFQESCNWPEARHRMAEMEYARKDHNAAMERQRLSADEVIALTPIETVYEVKLLKMNQNTDRYEVETQQMLRKQLFDDDRMLLHDVIGVKPLTFSTDSLFNLTCDRILLDDDRVVFSDDHPVVTGKALHELLEEPLALGGIHEVCLRPQTIPAFRKWLEDHRDGFIISIFNPISGSRFSDALEKLEREEARLTSTDHNTQATDGKGVIA